MLLLTQVVSGKGQVVSGKVQDVRNRVQDVRNRVQGVRNRLQGVRNWPLVVIKTNNPNVFNTRAECAGLEEIFAMSDGLSPVFSGQLLIANCYLLGCSGVAGVAAIFGHLWNLCRQVSCYRICFQFEKGNASNVFCDDIH
jgi:hypothetical protein